MGNTKLLTYLLLTALYLVDQLFLQFNKNLINNQELQSQIKNDETPRAEYPNEYDSEDSETHKISVIPNFVPKILSNNEIEEGINSLNSKQTEVCNAVQTWVII